MPVALSTAIRPAYCGGTCAALWRLGGAGRGEAGWGECWAGGVS